MLQDEINLGPNLQNMRIRCYSCKKTGHLINQCNLMHFCPDRERIIKYDDFSHLQSRAPFNRKKLAKKRYRIFEAKKIQRIPMPLALQTCDLDSSDEDNDDVLDSSQEKEKVSFFKQSTSKTDKFYSQNSSVATEVRNSMFGVVQTFEKAKTKNFNDSSPESKSNNNSERKSCLLEPKPRISVLLPDDQSKNVPLPPTGKRLSGVSRKSNQSVQFSQFNKMESKLESESKKEIDGDKKEDILPLVETTLSVEQVYLSRGFERIQNFRKYFPKNNMHFIKKRYNEMNPGLRLHKRKMQDLKKYSLYTFSASKMFSKMKKKNKIKTSVKKTNMFKSRCLTGKEGGKSMDGDDHKIDNFVKLVSKIMQSRKEKNQKPKWYTFLVRLFRRK